uniref:Dipeptidyl peptidase 4-like n=1 Tax=Gouania willdenowi TaxID=441366 RepID=A0A8C5I594_GOUWI
SFIVGNKSCHGLTANVIRAQSIQCRNLKIKARSGNRAMLASDTLQTFGKTKQSGCVPEHEPRKAINCNKNLPRLCIFTCELFDGVQTCVYIWFLFQAYVSDYNIFLKPNATAAEAIQVTHNGKKNEILNGIPDWVYEEEVFAANGALWWSSTGKYLAYAEFNDTEVQKVEFSWFGAEQYPQTVALPYPKSLLPVSALCESPVTLHCLYPCSDHILCSVTWVTDERVAVQWLSRKQNYALTQIYDYDGRGWIEKQYMPMPLFFTEDNLSFYKIMSDAKGYKHIHYIKDGKATPITSGKWEVISIKKLTKDAIFFVSNEHKGIPIERNLYKVLIGNTTSPTECLTCERYRDRCLYNSAYFSVNASYYRMECYGPGLPLYTVMDNKGSEVAVLEDNKDLEVILSEFQMPTIQHGTLKVAGYNFWYEMMLPPNFKKNKKYPLLIDVYGGPCSQSVEFRFKLNWGTYLASSLGIIVASFDGRGSGYQGDEILHSIYRRLGTFEVEDQIAAVRKFIDMGFIDKDRIAIWGWSYGGYVASMALGAGSGLFKCGIAGAPVSKWEYYDAVYTERYMGKPSDNSEFYQNSSVTSRAENFKSVDYLLVHGTADDNVHFQQAAQISKALVDKQVDFEAMWYTDNSHTFRGSSFHHIYIHMSHFLKKCLINPK